jgi:hypothetical protein
LIVAIVAGKLLNPRAVFRTAAYYVEALATMLGHQLVLAVAPADQLKLLVAGVLAGELNSPDSVIDYFRAALDVDALAADSGPELVPTATVIDDVPDLVVTAGAFPLLHGGAILG